MKERKPCSTCPWANKELKPDWLVKVAQLLEVTKGNPDIAPVQACHKLQQPSCLPLEDPASICVGHALHQLKNGDELAKEAVAKLL